MTSGSDVLIVEDDYEMVEVMEMTLRSAGYRTRTAMNGREALEAIADERPALVLLDMRMPIMNGWEAGREMRERYGRDLPIVVVTAAEHARARGEEVGADDALPKPFRVGDLLRAVERFAPRPARSSSS